MGVQLTSRPKLGERSEPKKAPPAEEFPPEEAPAAKKIRDMHHFTPQTHDKSAKFSSGFDRETGQL